MDKTTGRRAALCGLAAGAVNGLFGVGGGIVLLPLLARCGLREKECFATALGILLPLSVLSAVLWLAREPVALTAALPYLLGGVLGGFFAGKWMKKLPAVWLRRVFALLLLLSGARGVLGK